MSLPAIPLPKYKTIVPSTKEAITFHPFTTDEEKLLLMAMETRDEQVILRAMVDVIDLCVYEDIKTASLPTFDLEYLFLQLRAMSVGDVVEIALPCDGDNCSGKLEFSINLKEIEVEFSDNHKNNINLVGDMGIVLKYPSASMVIDSDVDDSSFAQMIDYVYDGDETFSDFTIEEANAFIGGMTKEQRERIKTQFIDSMPKLTLTKKYCCPKCGKTGSHTFEGLSDFF